MHFIKGKLLLFDLETDAKDPDDARLIEAAAVHVVPTMGRVERSWLAVPERPIPAEATGVHGITTERAAAEGKPRHEVLRQIVTQLLLWDDECPLIGHNINYDLTVLDRELDRVRGTRLELRGPVVDTFLLDKCLDQWRPGSRQLTDTARHYRINLDKAHSACADAVAAGQIAWRMSTIKAWPRGRYGPAPIERESRALIATGDAWALHEAQKRWFAVKQRELAEYFRTSKAVESIERKVAEGRMTRQAGDAAILDLPASADRAQALAEGGWPLRPLLATT